ncbi:hypothetical protein [Streptomyces sp. NPDC046925]
MRRVTMGHQHRDAYEEFGRRYRAELEGPEQQDGAVLSPCV